MSGRDLIVYEANEARPGSEIGSDDVEAFTDLIDRLEDACELDLLINSAGGDIEAAEKIIYMCRTISSSLRVIVPELAKSAATLIALGADKVVMGLQSELGPIDAQLLGPGPGGAMTSYSAQSFIDAFEDIKREVEEAHTGAVVVASLLPVATGIQHRLPRAVQERGRAVEGIRSEMASTAHVQGRPGEGGGNRRSLVQC